MCLKNLLHKAYNSVSIGTRVDGILYIRCCMNALVMHWNSQMDEERIASGWTGNACFGWARNFIRNTYSDIIVFSARKVYTCITCVTAVFAMGFDIFVSSAPLKRLLLIINVTPLHVISRYILYYTKAILLYIFFFCCCKS